MLLHRLKDLPQLPADTTRQTASGTALLPGPIEDLQSMQAYAWWTLPSLFAETSAANRCHVLVQDTVAMRYSAQLRCRNAASIYIKVVTMHTFIKLNIHFIFSFGDLCNLEFPVWQLVI